MSAWWIAMSSAWADSAAKDVKQRRAVQSSCIKECSYHQAQAPRAAKSNWHWSPSIDGARACRLHPSSTAMGVPVETWMIHEESKRIFCKQHPDKYPTEAHINVHGDKDVEYPLKFSVQWMTHFLERHQFLFRNLATKMNMKATTASLLLEIK